jgi:hypothetical protein
MPREEGGLTVGEKITLRRVAHGQSDVARLRVHDLERLRTLGLIDGGARRPRLTAEGQRRFDKLEKPVPIASLDAERELTAIVGQVMARAAASREGGQKRRRQGGDRRRTERWTG